MYKASDFADPCRVAGRIEKICTKCFSAASKQMLVFRHKTPEATLGSPYLYLCMTVQRDCSLFALSFLNPAPSTTRGNRISIRRLSGNVKLLLTSFAVVMSQENQVLCGIPL